MFHCFGQCYIHRLTLFVIPTISTVKKPCVQSGFVFVSKKHCCPPYGYKTFFVSKGTVPLLHTVKQQGGHRGTFSIHTLFPFHCKYSHFHKVLPWGSNNNKQLLVHLKQHVPLPSTTNTLTYSARC